MSDEWYNLILLEMNQARLKELQAAHDVAKFEAQRLKQQQQSGTQQHLVVSEKRQLGVLIAKAHREWKHLINNGMLGFPSWVWVTMMESKGNA